MGLYEIYPKRNRKNETTTALDDRGDTGTGGHGTAFKRDQRPAEICHQGGLQAFADENQTGHDPGRTGIIPVDLSKPGAGVDYSRKRLPHEISRVQGGRPV